MIRALCAGIVSSQQSEIEQMVHAVGGALVLLTIPALSVYKPWGRIGDGVPRPGRVSAT